MKCKSYVVTDLNSLHVSGFTNKCNDVDEIIPVSDDESENKSFPAAMRKENVSEYMVYFNMHVIPTKF